MICLLRRHLRCGTPGSGAAIWHIGHLASLETVTTIMPVSASPRLLAAVLQFGTFAVELLAAVLQFGTSACKLVGNGDYDHAGVGVPPTPGSGAAIPGKPSFLLFATLAGIFHYFGFVQMRIHPECDLPAETKDWQAYSIVHRSICSQICCGRGPQTERCCILRPADFASF